MLFIVAAASAVAFVPAEPVGSLKSWFDAEAMLRASIIPAWVRVEVLIDREGRPVACRSRTGSMGGQELDRVVCASIIKNARINPARIDNVPAPGTAYITLAWSPAGAGFVPENRSIAGNTGRAAMPPSGLASDLTSTMPAGKLSSEPADVSVQVVVSPDGKVEGCKPSGKSSQPGNREYPKDIYTQACKVASEAENIAPIRDRNGVGMRGVRELSIGLLPLRGEAR